MEQQPKEFNSQEKPEEKNPELEQVHQKKTVEELERELNNLIDWARIDSHPDDYKRIDLLKKEIEELRSKNEAPTENGEPDFDRLDIVGVREAIRADRVLDKVYNIAKNKLDVGIERGAPLKRPDVLREVSRILSTEKGIASKILLSVFNDVIKSHQK